MSIHNSTVFVIPDSVMNIIIVLMIITDNMTLSLRNIFFIFDSIIYDLIDGAKIRFVFFKYNRF